MDVMLSRKYAERHPDAVPKVLVYVVPNKALAKSIQTGYWFTESTPSRPIQTFVFNDAAPEASPGLQHEVVMIYQAALMTQRVQAWMSANHSRISRVIWDEFLTLVADCGWRPDILDIRITYPVQHVFLSGSAPQSLMSDIVQQAPFANLVGTPVVLQNSNRTVSATHALPKLSRYTTAHTHRCSMYICL